MIGLSIRQFFRDLLGSRLVARLEEDLLRVRTDYEERMRYQDDIINNLREEKAELNAKIIRYESTIMPLASRAGAELVKTARPVKPTFPNFDFSTLPPVQSRWQKVQEEHEKQMLEEIDAENQAAKAPQGTA